MLFLGLLTGVLFGAALVTAGLTNPRWIIGMLRFTNLHLLKTLVTAIAIGMVGMALFAAAGIGHFDVKGTHVLANVIGGVLFGVGFAYTGYCPGTALAGSAEGRADAPFVFLGGLVGTGLFTMLYDALVPLLIDPLSFGRITVHGKLGWDPLWVALPLFLLAAVLLWRTWRSRHHEPDFQGN